MYRYDRAAQGVLCLDDFLELLGDYEHVIERGSLAVQAFEYLQMKSAISLLQEGEDSLTQDEIKKVSESKMCVFNSRSLSCWGISQSTNWILRSLQTL